MEKKAYYPIYGVALDKRRGLEINKRSSYKNRKKSLTVLDELMLICLQTTCK